LTLSRILAFPATERELLVGPALDCVGQAVVEVPEFRVSFYPPHSVLRRARILDEAFLDLFERGAPGFMKVALQASRKVLAQEVFGGGIWMFLPRPSTLQSTVNLLEGFFEPASLVQEPLFQLQQRWSFQIL
jgi:hypothetical protein